MVIIERTENASTKKIPPRNRLPTFGQKRRDLPYTIKENNDQRLLGYRYEK